MAQEPIANKGNFLHIYDFRVQAGHEDEFVRLFEEFDYSDGNPMHKSSAQVKDGVLCRDVEDPQRFFLIAEWSDIEEHAKIRKIWRTRSSRNSSSISRAASSSPNMLRSYRPPRTRSCKKPPGEIVRWRGIFIRSSGLRPRTGCALPSRTSDWLTNRTTLACQKCSTARLRTGTSIRRDLCPC